MSKYGDSMMVGLSDPVDPAVDAVEPAPVAVVAVEPAAAAGAAGHVAGDLDGLRPGEEHVPLGRRGALAAVEVAAVEGRLGRVAEGVLEDVLAAVDGDALAAEVVGDVPAAEVGVHRGDAHVLGEVGVVRPRGARGEERRRPGAVGARVGEVVVVRRDERPVAVPDAAAAAVDAVAGGPDGVLALGVHDRAGADVGQAGAAEEDLAGGVGGGRVVGQVRVERRLVGVVEHLAGRAGDAADGAVVGDRLLARLAQGLLLGREALRGLGEGRGLLDRDRRRHPGGRPVGRQGLLVRRVRPELRLAGGLRRGGERRGAGDAGVRGCLGRGFRWRGLGRGQSTCPRPPAAAAPAPISPAEIFSERMCSSLRESSALCARACLGRVARVVW